MGESPFNLAYGIEVVIPVEIRLPSMRVERYDETSNLDHRRADLDLLSKIQEQAWLRMAAYQQRVARYYNRRVKPKKIHPEDLVLQKIKVSKLLDQEKLFRNWEGSYRVAETLRPGAYRLEILDGVEVLWIWNVDNLKVYYQWNQLYVLLTNTKNKIFAKFSSKMSPPWIMID